MKETRGVRSLPKDASYSDMNSPVGVLTVVASSKGLHAILWEDDLKNPTCAKMIAKLSRSQSEKTIQETKKQLSEYFQGKRKTFDLPLVLSGTDFQVKAWKQLINIPYGKTISYGEQAEKIGNKNKARAVGLANGSNPISIVVPCHRVIGSNGSLTGFGGGLDKKAFLLALEGLSFN